MTSPQRAICVPEGSCWDCGRAPRVRATGRGVQMRNCPVHGLSAMIEAEGSGTMLIRAGKDPAPTAAAFMTALMDGYSPTEQGQVRFVSRASIDSWMEWDPTGIDEVTAAIYAMHHLAPEHAALFLRYDVFDVRIPDRWFTLNQSYRVQESWLAVGITDPDKAAAWIDAKVAPEVAVRFEHPLQYLFAAAAGVPLDVEWGRLDDVVSPQFARYGFELGQSPVDVGRVGAVLGVMFAEDLAAGESFTGESGVSTISAWSAQQSARAVATATRFAAHPWSDVAACLEVGMGVEETFKMLTSGADLDPIRLTAALAR